MSNKWSYHRFAQSTWWTDNCFLTSHSAWGNFWTNLCFLASRFARGKLWTNHCFLASCFARCNTWINNCFLASRFARSNWRTTHVRAFPMSKSDFQFWRQIQISTKISSSHANISAHGSKSKKRATTICAQDLRNYVAKERIRLPSKTESESCAQILVGQKKVA